MIILQVIPVFSAPFGGPVTVVRSISKELAKRHEVTVYTTSALDHRRDFKNSPTEVESDGYRILYFPRTLRFTGFNVSPTMARALQKTLSEYDIIHLHSWRHFQDITVHYYAKKYGVPYVLQAHGSLPRIVAKQRLKWLYDVLFGYRLLRDAAKVIALSRVEAEQYRAMGVPEEKIAIIPNGIDLSEYENLPPKGSFKRKYGVPEHKKIILYLGRIHKNKGIDFLIKAYALLTNEMNSKDSVLVIAGPDDGYLHSAKSLVRLLRLIDNVLFTGLLAEYEKKCVLADSSLVVYPSPVEPFGLVALEAAASAKPPIVSNNTPMASIVKTGKFGFSVNYGDIVGLAEVMQRMLSSDNLTKEMGAKGRQFVSENFDWCNIVSTVETLYEEVIQEANNFL